MLTSSPVKNSQHQSFWDVFLAIVSSGQSAQGDGDGRREHRSYRQDALRSTLRGHTAFRRAVVWQVRRTRFIKDPSCRADIYSTNDTDFCRCNDKVPEIICIRPIQKLYDRYEVVTNNGVVNVIPYEPFETHTPWEAGSRAFATQTAIELGYW